MSKTSFGTIAVIGLVFAVWAGSGLAQDRKDPGDSGTPHGGHEAMDGCMEMMETSGVSEEGNKAMRELMRSERAPRAMAGMMDMARRMGDGDVMAGMTRMMEMMGSMGGGGMMGGHGGGHGGGAMGGQGPATPGQTPAR